MKMSRILIPVLAPMALAVSAGAAAGGPGYPPPPPPKTNEFMVRVGASYITPNSEQVSFVDQSFQYFDAFRARIDPDDEWGWFINGEWKPMDHWGVELSYIDGDSHEGGDNRGFFSIAGFDGEIRDLGEFEPEMSTVSVKWYPLDPSCLVQPYMGVGINYTDFSGEKFNGVRRSELRDLGLRGDFSLGNTWGYTWQVGADFYFGHDSAWLINVAAIYVDSETDMSFTVYDDGTLDRDYFFESYSGDYQYSPWTFNLGVGYRFDL